MNDLVDATCRQIRNDSNLSNGYNLIGFSQGGLFARALAQRCSSPQIRNLILIGGPQQGIFGFPHCPNSSMSTRGFNVDLCNLARELLHVGAYLDFVHKRWVHRIYQFNLNFHLSVWSKLSSGTTQIGLKNMLTRASSLPTWTVNFQHDVIPPTRRI